MFIRARKRIIDPGAVQTRQFVVNGVKSQRFVAGEQVLQHPFHSLPGPFCGIPLPWQRSVSDLAQDEEEAVAKAAAAGDAEGFVQPGSGRDAQYGRGLENRCVLIRRAQHSSSPYLEQPALRLAGRLGTGYTAEERQKRPPRFHISGGDRPRKSCVIVRNNGRF